MPLVKQDRLSRGTPRVASFRNPLSETFAETETNIVGRNPLTKIAVVSQCKLHLSEHRVRIDVGHKSGGAKGDLPPLFLPYYLVRVILEGGYDVIANGLRLPDLHERIRAIHHRGDDVRGSDMSNLLHGLANLQAVKSISPPIIDYDAQNRPLQVVDSTFYFFIKNANTRKILDSIPDPLNAG